MANRLQPTAEYAQAFKASLETGCVQDVSWVCFTPGINLPSLPPGLALRLVDVES